MNKHVEYLKKLNACSEAVEFAGKYSSLQKAWDACENGSWMLWLCGRLSGPPDSDSRKKVVLVACVCARLALKYTKDTRAKACIETAERYVRGKATLDEVRTAAAAFDAYAAAYAAAAAFDAYAAAYAAADATYATRVKTLKKCAEIVRKHYPKVPKGEPHE